MVETVKMNRFEILNNTIGEWSSIIDFLPRTIDTYPHWNTLVTVSTGNKELDHKLIKILFDIINNDKECLKLLDNPDK